MSTENESVQATHEWAKERRKEWEGMVSEKHPMVVKLDAELTNGGDHPVAGVAFAEFKSESFTGEVGKNDDGDLIFHFWPTANDRYHTLRPAKDSEGKDIQLWCFGEPFQGILGDAFVEVFRFEEKLCWDYVPEMNSWVVRAQGFGKNFMADELATKLFVTLKGMLES